MVIEHLIEPSYIIRFKNLEAIQINNGCSGTKQMLQVLVLFVLYPGPWIRKVWFIPTVIGAIYFVNLFRISLLDSGADKDGLIGISCMIGLCG